VENLNLLVMFAAQYLTGRNGNFYQSWLVRSSILQALNQKVVSKITFI